MSTDHDSLRAAEHRWQQAQLSGDLDELDRLLHPDVVFVGPDGTISDKQVDLAVHRDGRMQLASIDVESVHAHVADGTGVTVLTGVLTGSYAGFTFSTRQRYTRAWAQGPEGWRVVGAHASVIGPDTP